MHEVSCEKIILNFDTKMMRNVFFFVMILIITVSCQTADREKERAVVSVSIVPLEYFVDRLTGEAVEVNVMVPPGASHATYSPSTSQLQKLSDSQLYFRIGYLGYEEAFMHRLQAINPDMQVVNLSDGVSLIRGEPIDHGDHVHEGGIDPHIWMSPKVMLDRLPAIKEALFGAYPDIEEDILTNAAALRADIRDLDERMQQLTEELTQKTFLIFHPALTYMARDYGLHQIPIERHGKEPSPALLRHVIAEAREHGASVIFIQQEFDMRSAELVSAEADVNMVQINPLAYDWIGSVNHVMDVFEEHMK